MNNEAVNPSPAAATPEIETGGMRTGQGADDEPEMTIGDKYGTDPAPDPDGDGTLSVDEAEEMLGGDASAAAADTGG